MPPLTYYVAASLDGYIAGPDHQLDAFDLSPELAAVGAPRPATASGRPLFARAYAPRRFELIGRAVTIETYRRAAISR